MKGYFQKSFSKEPKVRFLQTITMISTSKFVDLSQIWVFHLHGHKEWKMRVLARRYVASEKCVSAYPEQGYLSRLCGQPKFETVFCMDITQIFVTIALSLSFSQPFMSHRLGYDTTKKKVSLKIKICNATCMSELWSQSVFEMLLLPLSYWGFLYLCRLVRYPLLLF